MLIGKVGHNYPINAQTYQCLYIGMKVDSKMADNNGPDVFQVFWFADELLNGAGGIWGYSKGIPLYPEAGKSTPAARWKIFKLNLADSNNFGGGLNGTTGKLGKDYELIRQIKWMLISRLIGCG